VIDAGYGSGSVIDLGLVTDDELDGSSDDPWRHAPSPVTRWLAVPLAIFGAVILTSSVAPPGPRTEPVLRLAVTRTVAQLSLTEDTLFTTGAGRVSAYELSTGQHLWDAGVPTLIEGGATPVTSKGVTIITSYGERKVTALDAATGAQLWQLDGLSMGFDDADTIMVSSGGFFNTVGQTEGVRTLSAVDRRTGRELWQWQAGPEVSMVRPVTAADAGADSDDQAMRLLVHGDQGQVSLVDPASGSSRDVDALRGTDVSNAAFVGSLLVVSDRARTWALDRQTLRLRWVSADGIDWLAARCGRLLCGYAGDGGIAVDPATGAVRWRSGQFTVIGDGTRVVAVDRRDGRAGTPVVLDSETGQPVADLTGWDVWDHVGPHSVLITRLRPDGIVELAVLDLGNLRADLVGAERGLLTGSCTASRSLLACRTLDNQLLVWRYRG
jgi:outer membrane protein assembly factor BamB